MRTIICKNNDGIEGRFTESFGTAKKSLLLESAEGIYTVKNRVTTSANTMVDGSTYQGSVEEQRNIVLTLRDHTSANHEATREFLYTLFKSKSKGTFIYIDHPGAEKKSIGYYVESINTDGSGNARVSTISLICPDPMFESPTDRNVVLAGWRSEFEFKHQFIQGGETMGEHVTEKLKTISNDSAADGIGMTITVTATGAVINPTIAHVERNEHISVGTSSYPLEMLRGDILEITTGTDNKHVYLIRDGHRTEINEYMSEDSEFIQIYRGDNTIGYSADVGDEYMTVQVSYRYKYTGV